MQDVRLAVRVTAEFKKMVEDKATELGISASAFIKMVLKEKMSTRG